MMTDLGKQSTLEGEFIHDLKSVFSFNRSIGVSYAVNMEDRGKLEIRMNYPDAKQGETLQMVFVLKGKVSLRNRFDHTCWTEIDTFKHNLCHIPLNSTYMVMDNHSDEIICIHLNKSFLSRYLPKNHPAHQHLMANQNFGMPKMLLPFNMHITPELSSILLRLGNPSENEFCDQLMLESKVIELLALQLSQFNQLKSKTSTFLLKNEDIEKMQKVKELLINQTGKQLSLLALARLVGTNDFDLKRNFKAVFGNTVYGYLTQYKMEQAKDMLLEKDVTIADVSKKSGYKHPTHFTNAFKKHFGYLPNKIKSIKIVLLILGHELCAIFEGFEFLAG